MKLIIGKGSLIARKLSKRNEYRFTTSNINEVGCFFLNLNDPSKFDFNIISNHVTIIFLAAVSSPDDCENKFDDAYNVNVIGTKYFIKEALTRGAKVLFFSSDVVYGNRREAVDENSQTAPYGNYGIMKDEIENFFEGELNFKVFRLSYVLSDEDKYLSYLKSCVANNQVAEVYHPLIRKVVYIDDVIEAVENILVKWNDFENNKFNICGNEDISRKDIADFYNKLVGNRLEYRLLEPDERFWQARPMVINIKSIYFNKLVGRNPITIQNAISNIVSGEE